MATAINIMKTIVGIVNDATNHHEVKIYNAWGINMIFETEFGAIEFEENTNTIDMYMHGPSQCRYRVAEFHFGEEYYHDINTENIAKFRSLKKAFLEEFIEMLNNAFKEI